MEASGAPAHDPARRAFFLDFGKQAVTAAGQVAGMADLVGRASGGGVASLLGLDAPRPAPARPTFTRSPRRALVSSASPAADGVHRSAYRVTEDGLVLLDQRGIPEQLDEVLARRGSDVAYYLGLGVARGGALMAQIAAYGLALTARERAAQPAASRELELRRTMQALRQSRPSARLLAWSMERMGAVIDASARAGDDGDTLAAALRTEADAIATDIAAWNAAIAAALYTHLASRSVDSLVLLLHGLHGALGGGVVGSGLPALQRLLEMGRGLRVFVTEGRPFMDGARLSSWELRQAGIDHKVIPDSAVAWLLHRERVDAVLVGAEWVAANGDIGALVGSRAVAQLAAVSGTHLIASGLSACLDPTTPDGSAMPDELRPVRDLTDYLADVPIRDSDALVPAADVMPAATIGAVITEQGVASTGGAG